VSLLGKKQKVKKYTVVKPPTKHTSVITLTISADSAGALQGKMIKLARLSKDMTQEELAKALNVNRATISKWESVGFGSEIYRLEEVLSVERGAFNIPDV
jgi:DNA-binding XRE family transcriptional regulator